LKRKFRKLNPLKVNQQMIKVKLKELIEGKGQIKVIKIIVRSQ
jgi:hypothetical protein